MTGIPSEAELLRKVVPIAGAHNFRDVGGYATAGGGSTRWGMLFRSDALHRLGSAAQQSLRDLDIRTVIDLRRDVERIANPDAVGNGGPIVIACPILDDIEVRAPETTLPQVYDRIIDMHGTEVARAVRILAASDALPAVVHCTAGKDRTGVVIALLLSSLGVPDELVVSDFAATELFLTAEFVAELAVTDPPDIDSPLLRADAAQMSEVLTRVRKEYGSALSFLMSHGLTEAEHARLTERLIEPAVG